MLGYSYLSLLIDNCSLLILPFSQKIRIILRYVGRPDRQGTGTI
jgi:hypothetical protein